MIDADRFRSGRPRQPGQASESEQASWGIILYRGAAILGAVVILLGAVNYFYNLNQDRPLVPLVPFVAGGVIWLVGCVLRYLLTDR